MSVYPDEVRNLNIPGMLKVMSDSGINVMDMSYDRRVVVLAKTSIAKAKEFSNKIHTVLESKEYKNYTVDYKGESGTMYINYGLIS